MRSLNIKIIGEYKNMKNSFTADEILYYFFLCLMFIAKGIGMDSGQKIFQVCMLISLFCFGLKILITRYSIKEWGVISILI